MSTERPDVKRVLIVDDHQLTRSEMVQMLRRAPGLDVVAEAASGEEAVEAARRVRPEVVVMDILLPAMNGIEATRAIIAERGATRIVALSNHSGPNVVKAFLEAGGLGYVRKDYAFEELLPAIRSILEQKLFLGTGVME